MEKTYDPLTEDEINFNNMENDEHITYKLSEILNITHGKSLYLDTENNAVYVVRDLGHMDDREVLHTIKITSYEPAEFLRQLLNGFNDKYGII